MENIIDIFVKIVAALLAIGITWLIGKARDYLTAKATAAGNDDLVRLIEQFCAAAEQQLKVDDPTGEKRKEYVYMLLKEANVEVTEVVDAVIEAAVYRINHKGV